MLDLDHPLTASIFAASRQLDLVLHCAAAITTSGTEQRRRLFEIASPAFAALRWLNDTKWDSSSEIADAIDRFEETINALAEMDVQHQDEPRSGRKKCPVCDARLQKLAGDPKRKYCSHCYESIVPALNCLEECTGIAAI